MALIIYNTLSRRKEEFQPLVKGNVGMYVCGPTVYGHSHVGHAKSYICFDIIVRYLRYLGYKVTYVQNITDVGHLLGETNEGEDRLLKASRIEQKHPMQVAEEYTRSYFDDMDALGVTRPDISPRATGHISEQIELVEEIIRKGYAYEVNGSVYFDVSKDKDYGKLSGRSTDDTETGTRVELRSEKRHPNDFALWKRAEPEHIMRWRSPWSVGFPGWHVECSAMSMKYLGITFDIHGGGMDNQFPHHECEIAQSEKATGKPFVRYWIHNNLVTVNGQKMSKSLGNVILLKDAFKKYSPRVIRFFILQSHYRSTLDFSDEALAGAERGLEKITNALRHLQAEISKRKTSGSDKTPENMGAGIDLAGFRNAFIEAMNDDFNTPQAIAVIFDLSREVNSMLTSGSASISLLSDIEACYADFGEKILGIIGEDEKIKKSDDASLLDQLMRLIVNIRSEARSKKLWDLSDSIRNMLSKAGIVIEDTKDGTTWRRS
jgi:cysteinyl-tRNA synthetase